MSRGHLQRGADAEEFAAQALRGRGCRILDRNVQTPHGEIDVVAEKRGTFVFVEVKARRPGGTAGGPEEALTPTKLRRVARAAEHLLASRGRSSAPREFLGAAVDLDAEGRPSVVRFVPITNLDF